ncbi:hypothetical protein QTI99_10340 [Clostridium perfringens]|uniref:hypothetical protein n=1 Tax=Clostridium perfringens TaxID=1502 RepID=UPI002910220D|nr:hypothetical protein [Clostridium perfringens]EJT6171447.1 hypothetical protein [Clostridium perfringens]EJT6542172.1 hypothetical protein [Clostridium perfringens]EJT6567180.1 hypothetical protein [Clostridium perfringens]MBS5995298.1 hypothetical protein [Clostridium perfringens]MDM0997869.1 hypothetical protein [Clostridium perfringens]
MINKKDIENLKSKLGQSIGKTIILRYNYNKTKGVNKGYIGTYIIENVCRNLLVLRKVIKGNIGLIESYTFTDILNGFVEIVDIK